jgi:hypothetical protein
MGPRGAKDTMRFRERLDSTSLPRDGVSLGAPLGKRFRSGRNFDSPFPGSVRSVPPASMLAAPLRGPQAGRLAANPDADPPTWIIGVSCTVPAGFRFVSSRPEPCGGRIGHRQKPVNVGFAEF